MCGRLCCYCKHSSYSKRLEPVFITGKQPPWIDSSKFSPSSNLAPTRNVPVLYIDEESDQLSIRPMVWGIELSSILNSKGKSPLLHNIRIETLLKPQEKERKKFCAIVCDGFYEWNKKRPFFFYNSKSEFDTSIITPKWKEDDWIEKGPAVMVLAGVYSKTVNEGEEGYSCAVITKDASSRTKHIHHRIPIMLETEEDIMAWLNRKGKTVEQSLQTLIAMKNETLSFYEVNDQVNNSRYQELDCHLPLSCFRTSGTLNQWLSKSKALQSPSTDSKKINVECPSGKRKSSADSPSKKKSRITDWFTKAPPNP